MRSAYGGGEDGTSWEITECRLYCRSELLGGCARDIDADMKTDECGWDYYIFGRSDARVPP